MKQKLSIILLTLTFLVACNSTENKANSNPTTNSNDDANAVVPKVEEKTLRTNVYISEHCLFEPTPPEPEAFAEILIGALVPLVVNSAVDYYKKKLTEIKKNENKGHIYADLYRVVDTTDKYAYPILDPSFTCVTVITGMFYLSQLNKGFYSHAREISYTDLEKLDTTEKVVKYLNENLPIVAPQNAPSSYEPKPLFETGELYSVYEYKMHQSNDKTGFKVENTFLHVAKLLKDEKARGQIYITSIMGPGKTESGSEYATITMNFGEVTPGTTKTFKPTDKNWMTGYYQTPGMSMSSWGAFVRDVTPIITSPTFKPADLGEMIGKVYSPVRIDVTNVQLKEPTKGDKFLAELLENIKEPLSTAIVSKLTPIDNEEAKRDAKIALQEAATAYNTAINAETSDSYNIELQKLKFDKACEAYKELGGICMALPVKP